MAQADHPKSQVKPRVLVAPLDWGLGHATRCIPIIRELLAKDCEVWLAGEGIQEALLRSEFPGLPFLQLPGYQISYSKTKHGLLWKILMQLPRILSIARKENKWLKKMVMKHGFDAVISDNRFGLYHDKIPCIFITHQLNIQTPLGKWSSKILQKWNHRYINRFSACWVPDLAGDDNLAGNLSHPLNMPAVPVSYIGPLSRFEKKGVTETKDHLLIILSGPEPQRSILEKKVINQVGHYPGTATVVRGLPSSLSIIPSTNMIRFYNHLPAKELNEEMEKAEWVIGRCGYSSVMDIVRLQKKSILVPTPGQTEQEYLGSYLQQKQIVFCINQNNFSLSPDILKARAFNYKTLAGDSSQGLQIVVQNLIARLV